jgi:TonB-dependent receptor
VNLALNVTRDFIWRLAAAKVMARPQLGQPQPRRHHHDDRNLSITVGNPLLQPFRAKTYDTSFEWYFGKGGLLGIGLFYKDIGTYIQTLRTNVPYNETGLPLSLPAVELHRHRGLPGDHPVNTKGGRSRATRSTTSRLHDAARLLEELRDALNYTYVKSKIEYLISPTSTATITDDLLNLSPKSWNATLYYDDGRFTARASAAHRTTFLTRVPGQNNNDVEGKNGTTNVDASISYRINKNVQLVFEASTSPTR